MYLLSTSAVDLSLIKYFSDFILKPPSTAVKCWLDSARLSEIFQSHTLLDS